MPSEVKARAPIPVSSLFSVRVVHLLFFVSVWIASCRSSSSTSGPLIDFQVAQPPAVPASAKQCTIHLLSRSFANSSGNPEVIQYTPPTNCGSPGSWAAITLNWTATSSGKQFDRLGAITFHNVEIWRTSTPEPTLTGIIWTYIKDVTRYIPLFSQPGTLILDLENTVESSLNLTASYDVNLSATFYESSFAHPSAPKSNHIIPISSLSPNTTNVVAVPPALTVNTTFPTNTVGAYAELYLSGSGTDEFWYSNVNNQFLNDLPSGTTAGDGPFREARLLVDGMVAGVAFPYPVLFTGAIVPDAWRPITSYGALDLPTYYVDLTPFVPLLSDGKSHSVTLDVVSAEANHTINDNWFVSGNIQIVTDPSEKPTTGKITSYDVSEFAVSSTKGVLSNNGDLTLTVNASRHLRIESEIRSGSGKSTKVVWQQDLSYTNFQSYQQNASIRIVKQTSGGSTISTHNGVAVVKDNFNYPLGFNFTMLPPSDVVGWTTLFDHSYDRQLIPGPFIVGSTINNRQIANGSLLMFPNGTNGGQGSNDNTFDYFDLQGNTYSRTVSVADNAILFDRQKGNLKPTFVTEPSNVVKK